MESGSFLAIIAIRGDGGVPFHEPHTPMPRPPLPKSATRPQPPVVPPQDDADGPVLSQAQVQLAPASGRHVASPGPREALVSDSPSIYGVVNLIDKGGMGIVYEVRDQRLNRSVALKVMMQTEDKNPDLTQRFIEEAQVTSQLEHPNIIPLHELAVDGEGRMFFTMKLVRGETLATLLSRWREQETSATLLYEALTIVIKVCDALAFAHSKGVVHRDIKPANIMIGEYGEVLVMDWGIARVLSKQSSAQDRTRRAPRTAYRDRGALDIGTTTALTLDGDIIGTPGYMAPEQARGDIAEIDGRTDIYSVGAIIYELLAGVRAITGATSDVVSKTIDGVIVPPSELAPDRAIPGELEAVAMKAMSLAMADRYQNMRELAHDLESYLAGRSVSAKRDSMAETVLKMVRRNLPITITIAVATAALLITSVILFMRIHNQQELREKAEYDAGVFKNEEVDKEHQRVLAFDPYASGIDLLSRSDFARPAVEMLRSSIAIDPNFIEAHFALGQALGACGDPKAAADEFLKADQLSRTFSKHADLQAILCAAFAQDNAGLFNEAARSFAEADGLGGSDPLVLVGRCFHLGAEYRLDELLRTAHEAVRGGPKLWETHFALGYALYLNAEAGTLPPEQLKVAGDEFEKVKDMEAREIGPQIWWARVRIRDVQPHRKEALDTVENLTIRYPRSPTVYFARGEIEFRSGDLFGGKIDLDKLVQMNAEASLITALRLQMAILTDDKAELLNQSARAYQLYPTIGAEERWLCQSLICNRADACAQQLSAFHSEHPGTILDDLLLVQEAWNAGHYAQCQQIAEQGLTLAPYSIQLQLDKAKALAAQGRTQDALDLEESVFSQNPYELAPGLATYRMLVYMQLKEQASHRLVLLEQRFPGQLAYIQGLGAGTAATAHKL